jgi:transcriptional regulator GlxA family with amidase domain
MPSDPVKDIDDAEVFFVAENKGEIGAGSDFVSLNAKYDISEITDGDVLLIPGSSISFVREMKNKKLLNWIREMDKTTTWTTSVCTGSLILAAAGLLNGLEATSHWKPINLLKDYGATPKRERIVEQGKYITAAGVSAGIDLALYLTDKIAGETEAKVIQLRIEYDPQPLYHSGNYSEAGEEIIKIAERKMEKKAKKEIGLMDMIRSGRTILKIKNSK